MGENEAASNSSAFDLLERISIVLESPFDRLKATEAVHSLSGMGFPLIEITSRVAQQFRINAHIDHCSLQDALSFVHPSAPILVISPKCIDGALIVDSASHNVKSLEDATGPREWITRKNLLQRLGLKDESESVDTLLLQQALPYAHIRHEEHPHGISPVSCLFALLKAEKTDVLSVIIYAIGIGLLSLATPLAVESLVTSIAVGGLLQPLLIVSLLPFGSLAFAAILRIMQTILVEYLQRRMFVRLVADLSNRLPRVPIAAFDTQHGPELLNRFFDIVTVQKVYSIFLLEGISFLPSTLIGAVLLAVYHPYILLYDIVLIAAMIGIIFLLGKGAIQMSIDESLTKYSTTDLIR